MGGDFAQGDEGAEPETRGAGLDPVQPRDLLDVHHPIRLGDPFLHLRQEIGPAGEDPRLSLP